MRPRLASFVPLVLLALAGCGKPALVPVTGQVKIDGKPAANVRVYFWPDPKPESYPGTRIGIGCTDESGRFTLKAGTGDDGLERGNYRVTFSLFTYKGKALKLEERYDGAVDVIPMPYRDHDSPHNSPVAATVDGTPLSFALPAPAKR